MDLTISFKDILELEVWVGCCLVVMAAYITCNLGGFKSRVGLLVDFHN
jgi:hypothetical protein